MPIRPEERAKYPRNWPEISGRIRFVRAAGVCECRGECGKHEAKCSARHGLPHPKTRSKVVLTVAHLDRNPEHCDEGNLLAMCQACHLAYDQDQHRTNAAATRSRKRDDESGQGRLF